MLEETSSSLLPALSSSTFSSSTRRDSNRDLYCSSVRSNSKSSISALPKIFLSLTTTGSSSSKLTLLTLMFRSLSVTLDTFLLSVTLVTALVALAAASLPALRILLALFNKPLSLIPSLTASSIIASCSEISCLRLSMSNLLNSSSLVLRCSSNTLMSSSAEALSVSSNSSRLSLIASIDSLSSRIESCSLIAFSRALVDFSCLSTASSTEVSFLVSRKTASSLLVVAVSPSNLVSNSLI